MQDSQVGKYVVGPRNLQYFKNFFGIIVLQFVGHLLIWISRTQESAQQGLQVLRVPLCPRSPCRPVIVG